MARFSPSSRPSSEPSICITHRRPLTRRMAAHDETIHQHSTCPTRDVVNWCRHITTPPNTCLHLLETLVTHFTAAHLPASCEFLYYKTSCIITGLWRSLLLLYIQERVDAWRVEQCGEGGWCMAVVVVSFSSRNHIESSLRPLDMNSLRLVPVDRGLVDTFLSLSPRHRLTSEDHRACNDCTGENGLKC